MLTLPAPPENQDPEAAVSSEAQKSWARQVIDFVARLFHQVLPSLADNEINFLGERLEWSLRRLKRIARRGEEAV